MSIPVLFIYRIIQFFFGKKSKIKDDEYLSKIDISYEKVSIFNNHTGSFFFYLNQIEKVQPYANKNDRDVITIYQMRVRDSHEGLHFFYFIPLKNSLDILKTYISRYDHIVSQSKKM